MSSGPRLVTDTQTGGLPPEPPRGQEPLRIAFVEGPPEASEVIRERLVRDGRLRIVSSHPDWRAVIAALRGQSPDVVVVHGAHPVGVAGLVHVACPAAIVVVLDEAGKYSDREVAALGPFHRIAVQPPDYQPLITGIFRLKWQRRLAGR